MNKRIEEGDKINVAIAQQMQPVPVTVIEVGDEVNPWIVEDLDGSIVQFHSYVFMVKPSKVALERAEKLKAEDDLKKKEQAEKIEKARWDSLTPEQKEAESIALAKGMKPVGQA